MVGDGGRIRRGYRVGNGGDGGFGYGGGWLPFFGDTFGGIGIETE